MFTAEFCLHLLTMIAFGNCGTIVDQFSQQLLHDGPDLAEFVQHLLLALSLTLLSQQSQGLANVLNERG
jgi:hypothetical protein